MPKVDDEELKREDAFELITTFINRSVKAAEISGHHSTAGRRTSGAGMSFVITRGRSSSWAEDLADFITNEERNRLYS